MLFNAFYSDEDRARAAAARPAEAAETRARALLLRRHNEAITAALMARLPFSWLVGKAVRRYQGPPVWERGPAALHIQLQEPVQFTTGRTDYSRRVGDWLCSAALDESTGELRYQPAEASELWHSDGSGGPLANYLPAPTCKKCLTLADKVQPLPDGEPLTLRIDGKS
jgi:hypothetical protein